MKLNLEFGRWYVVKVGFSSNNPIHTAILGHAREQTDRRYNNENYWVELFGDYEGIVHIQTKDLFHIEVVCEIPQMHYSWNSLSKEND